VGRRWLARIALLIAIALLGWLMRATQHRKVELPGYTHWVTTDPDSLHQLRRIERIFREGPPAAERDAELSWPDGSALPAPPYYPLVAWSLLAPFAPEDAKARRGWLEEHACMLPAVFGVLAGLVGAWAALELLGLGAAAFVGLSLAVAPGAIHYSCVGNGDYQSWSLLLGLAQLGLLSSVLKRGVLERRGPALGWGAVLGAWHGLAIGSWTPALIQLVIADAALAVCIVVHTRSRRLATLPFFGLALHLSALVVLAPAIASSPWRLIAPWQVVCLSWFHAAYLLLGAAVFAGLIPWRRPSYPWIVAGVLTALGAACWLLEIGPAAALGEAFSWAGAENVFMSQVAESAPLVGAGGWSKLFLYVGYGALLAPLALPALAWTAWRERRLEWTPWCLALLAFGVMAAAQMRFAELVVAPLALAIAASCNAIGRRLRLRLPAWGALALAVLAALGLHWIGVRSTIQRGLEGKPFTEALAKRSARMLADWLRQGSPPRSAVMAVWNFGHLIQWAAERPIVSSNYGLYVGREPFLDSLRFFAGDDAGRAEDLLARRDVRYVLITTDFERLWGTFAAALAMPSSPQGYSRSIGARLLGAGPPLDFLRIVHASPLPDPRRTPPGSSDPIPSGLLLERVPGAWIEAHGTPGALLELSARLRVGSLAFSYAVSAAAGADGVARVRTPYACEPVGELTGLGPFEVRFAGSSSSVDVRESDVRSGTVILLR